MGKSYIGNENKFMSGKSNFIRKTKLKKMKKNVKIKLVQL